MRTLLLFTLLFIVYPCAFAQWEWQYPLPTENDLEDVFFVDELKGWAVGENGTILHTSDGGTNWELQVSNTTLRLRSVIFTDPLTGWIVGGETYPIPGEYIILYTDDAGDEWTIQAAAEASCMKSVFFTDAVNGWSTGSDGALLHTSNGGMDWISQWNGSPTVDFNELFFVDSLNGWIASEQGLYKTTNGGINWFLQMEGPFLSVYFISQTEGWVTNWGSGMGYSYVFHSLDAFNTYDTVTSCFVYEASCAYYSVSFHDPGHGGLLQSYCPWNGWLGPCSYGLLLTQDGGITWENAELPGSNIELNSVHFTPDGKGYLVADDGVILRSAGWNEPWLIMSEGQDVSDLRSVSEMNLKCHPNPTVGISDIRYQIPDIRFVLLELYDVCGQRIRTLVNEVQTAGEYTAPFGALDLPAGIYFIRLQITNQSMTTKLIKM